MATAHVPSIQRDLPRLTAGLRFVAFIAANLLFALIGTAIFETTAGKFFQPRTLTEILWKEWTLSVVCASFLGFGVHRGWKNAAAKWTWILPSLWFLIRFVPALLSGASKSVFGFQYPNTSLWFQFSGLGCKEGSRALGCMNFLIFTIPLIRGFAYSFGSYLSARMDSE